MGDERALTTLRIEGHAASVDQFSVIGIVGLVLSLRGTMGDERALTTRRVEGHAASVDQFSVIGIVGLVLSSERTLTGLSLTTRRVEGHAYLSLTIRRVEGQSCLPQPTWKVGGHCETPHLESWGAMTITHTGGAAIRYDGAV